MWCVEVRLPGGRYYAARAEAPDEPEWPPHPARLFSALVAAGAGAGGLDEASREALRWLESREPPWVEAPEADGAGVPVSYVPPGDFTSQRNQVEHPVWRIRKDRHFACAWLLAEPVVRFYWRERPPEAVGRALERLCARLTHLGTSHAMALARVVERRPEGPCWRPDPDGEAHLRVPVPGRLEELERAHAEAGRGGLRRPPPACEPYVPYRKEGSASPHPLFARCLIYRLPAVTHGLEAAERLARSLRAAVMSHLGEGVPEAVHGHWDGAHVGWLVLADVRDPMGPQARFARGRVLGVAVALPHGLAGEGLQRLYRALAGVVGRGLRLPDGRLTPLEPPALDRPLPRSLRLGTWRGPARLWGTVTPVVPDRLPCRPQPERVRRAVVESLRRVGFPEPEAVEVSRYSAFQGAPAAGRFPCRLPRYHAVVRFREPVSGPVLAGRLRYFGVGLFRPLREPG